MTLLFRNFYSGPPDELVKAARVDAGDQQRPQHLLAENASEFCGKRLTTRSLGDPAGYC
jgi:hypothetical protein